MKNSNFFDKSTNIYKFLWLFLIPTFLTIFSRLVPLSSASGLAVMVWGVLFPLGLVWIVIWLVEGYKRGKFAEYFYQTLLFIVLILVVGLGSCAVNLGLIGNTGGGL